MKRIKKSQILCRCHLYMAPKREREEGRKKLSAPLRVPRISFARWGKLKKKDCETNSDSFQKGLKYNYGAALKGSSMVV